MAEAQLNFNEETLDKESGLYNLYSRLYEGMRAANDCTPPDFTTNPPVNENGEIDSSAIAASLLEYSTILMKNSAYLYASSIITVVGENSGDIINGCILRSGDAMEGMFSALYGFRAGVDGHTILELSIDENDVQNTHLYGNIINHDGSIQTNALKVGDGGIYFGENQILYLDQDGNFCIDSDNIKLGGSVAFSEIRLGGLLITDKGISLDGNVYYHAGNSNNLKTDWTMKEAEVGGNLFVHENGTIEGMLTVEGGFAFTYNDIALMYTSGLLDDEAEIVFNADICLKTNRSIKVEDSKIIAIRHNNDKIVSFSAPGMVMNLGDSDGDLPTKYISLQAGLYNAAGNIQIVSKYGDGNFYGSFKAGCGGASSIGIETYLNQSNDYGVIFNKFARLGSKDGPYLSTNETFNSINLNLPFTCVDSNNTQINVELPLQFKLEPTTSLYADLSKSWSASLHVNTDAEFVVFDKQIEAKSFAIESTQYQTRLIENALFFSDNIFVEGLPDGMLHSGNSYFSKSISSREFASGFAGYGWAILENETYGGFAATVDELTVRKKMRVYELEVQKMSVTNGSLWVSDSCSGDIVEEIS